MLLFHPVLSNNIARGISDLRDKPMNKSGTLCPSRPIINHYLIEVFGLAKETLSDAILLDALVRKFASINRLQIVKDLQFEFEPTGLTLMYILSASHLVAHTWPEVRYLHLDLMSCDHRSTEGLEKELEVCAISVFGAQHVIVTAVVYAS